MKHVSGARGLSACAKSVQQRQNNSYREPRRRLGKYLQETLHRLKFIYFHGYKIIVTPDLIYVHKILFICRVVKTTVFLYSLIPE
jgi:hypothetical protein